MTGKTTLGRLPREAIRALELPPIDNALIEAYKALTDLTGTVSDAMDELGASSRFMLGAAWERRR